MLGFAAFHRTSGQDVAVGWASSNAVAETEIVSESDIEADIDCAPTGIWEIFGPLKFPKFPVIFFAIEFRDWRRPVVLILDTETTGLSPKVDRIVELAMVDENGTTVYQSLFNPGMPIPSRATEIHHITNSMVSSAPRFADEIPKIRRLIADHGNHVVAFNAAFDLGFLKGEAPENAAVPEDATVECAMGLACHALKLTSGRISLGSAAHYAGHEWTGDAHRARADALAALTVWRWAKGKVSGFSPGKSTNAEKSKIEISAYSALGSGSETHPSKEIQGASAMSILAKTVVTKAVASTAVPDGKVAPVEISLSAETARKVERLAKVLDSIAQFQAEEKALKGDLRLVADGRAISSTVGNLVLGVQSPKHYPASASYSVDEPAFYALPPEARQRLLDAGAIRAAYVVDGDGYEALKPETKTALEKRGVVAVERKAERTSAAAVSVR